MGVETQVQTSNSEPSYVASPHLPPNPNLDPSPPPSPSFSLPLPAVRLTSEFDSDAAVFSHKLSCKFFDRLAKIKLSFQNDRNGDISSPQLGFISKYLSLIYDFEDQNAVIKGSFDVGNKLQFRAFQDVKAQQGEVAMVASLLDPSYKLELASVVPSAGLPRATLRFPLGEVSLEEKEAEEKTVLSISGIVKSQMLNGICTALYREDELNLRYSYKDEQVSLIPSITLPSNVVSFAFKRRLSDSDKFSYWYNFDSNYWSAVYKRTVGKDLKFKAGYDSEVRLGWASLWLGEEDGKAKTAPFKMRTQLMLQVPQDDISASFFMFRVKKRWDF